MRKLLAVTTLFAAIGCAGEGDIDRTQTNKVHKSVFQGVWYVGATVTDVPATSAATFVGDQSGIEKIVWDIQENYLIGYRAYEELPGSDPRVDHDPPTGEDGTPAVDDGTTGVQEGQGEGFPNNQGIFRENPLVVFEIDKHFDIRRDYNANTGEQLNVIEENEEDRPWFEREWMRVNWGQNLVATGGATSFSFTTPGVAQVVFWHQMAEGSEDSIRWIDDTGRCVNFDGRKGGEWARENCIEHGDAGPVTYFDMVSEFVLTPAADADGNLLCLMPDMFPATCGATRVKARTAFMRVGQTEEVPITEGSEQTMHVATTRPQEFEPTVYDDRMLGKFGYFRTERQTYDRGYETTESGRIYLAQLHPIWHEVWEKDGQGNVRLDENGQKIPIPVESREGRPIVYHLSPHFRPELLPAMEDVAHGWNRAYRQAVALAKGLIPDEYDDVDDIPEDVVPRMFKVNYNGWVCSGTWNHGTCEGGDISYDETHQVARLGDLRYNFMTLIDQLQITSPFGYGPSLADPESGQIISWRANVYGAVLDRQAQYALDIVKVLNGDLQDLDFVSGDYVRQYVERHLDPIDPRNIPAALKEITLDREGLEKLLGPRLAKARRFMDAEKLTDVLPQVPRDWHQQRFEKILGTDMEPYLMTDAMRAELAGPALGFEWTPGQPIPEDIKEYTNIDRWLSPKAMERTRWRIEYSSSKNVWLEEFVDDSIYGLATALKDEYAGDEDLMRHRLREIILRAVMEHEVGHTLGLRHNFAASYDALNYHDEYWNLKQESFQNLGSVKPANTFDQIYELNAQTETQKASRMREYQYSSIMDYGGQFNADVQGLGKYDMAAIAFGYAGAVEVIDESKVDADLLEQMKWTSRARYKWGGAKCLTRFDDRRAPFFPMLTEEYHYTTVAEMLGVTPDDLSPLRARRWTKWSDLAPMHEAAYQDCIDHMNSSADPDTNFDGYLIDEGDTSAGDIGYTEPDRPLEYPYAFCGDEYAETTISCHRWDEGADPLEIAQRGARNYEAYYFFRTYRNDRFPFASSSYLSGLTGRTLFILPTVYQNWLGELNFNDGAVDVVQILASTMGMQLGFDTLTRILMRPSYGKYEEFPLSQQWFRTDIDPDTPIDSSTEVLVPRGPGRTYQTDYDFTDHGYAYTSHIREQAHYWDAQAALQMLTGATVALAGVDVQADQFLYLTPYEAVFGDELFRLFNGLWAGEFRLFAPRIETDRDVCESLGQPIDVGVAGCYLDRPLASYINEELSFDYIDPRDLTVWPDEPVGSPVSTGAPFIVQAWAIQTGMATFGFGRFYDFQDSNYVWLRQGEEPTIPEPPTTGLTILAADTVNNEFTVEGLEIARFPAGSIFRVLGSTGNTGDYRVHEDGPRVSGTGTDTIVPVTLPIPDGTADGFIPEPYWEVMECHDPRIWNGQTWKTLRKTDGSVDDRPAVIWMARCWNAQRRVEQATPGTDGYDNAVAAYDGVVWRLDWMRSLNAIFGHNPF